MSFLGLYIGGVIGFLIGVFFGVWMAERKWRYKYNKVEQEQGEQK